MLPWKDKSQHFVQKKGSRLSHRIMVLALRIYKKGLSLGNESVFGFYFLPFACLRFSLVQLTCTAFVMRMKNTIGVVKGDSKSPSPGPW